MLTFLAACNGTIAPTAVLATEPVATIIAPPAASPTALPPLVVMTTVPVTAAAPPAPLCTTAPPTRMIVGEHGWMLGDDPSPLNVRTVPGTGETRIVGRLQAYDVFMILDGPRCAETYVWYYIRFGDLFGWVAEGDFAGYYIGPYLPG